MAVFVVVLTLLGGYSLVHCSWSAKANNLN